MPLTLLPLQKAHRRLMRQKDQQIARTESSRFKSDRKIQKEITMLRDQLKSSDIGCARAIGSLDYEVAAAVRESNRVSGQKYSSNVQTLKDRLKEEITQREVND